MRQRRPVSVTALKGELCHLFLHQVTLSCRDKKKNKPGFSRKIAKPGRNKSEREHRTEHCLQSSLAVTVRKYSCSGSSAPLIFTATSYRVSTGLCVVAQ